MTIRHYNFRTNQNAESLWPDPSHDQVEQLASQPQQPASQPAKRSQQ